MRILNEKDQEIQQSDVNLDLGYLKPDRLFIKHHDEVPSKEEVFHYEVENIYFENAEPMMDIQPNDPHVVVVDKENGLFNYVNLEGEDRNLRGIDIKRVVDEEATEGKKAYDEYEDIQRYVLFTPEELEAMKTDREETEKRETFLKTGPDRLTSTETDVSDLTILIADMVGM